MDRLVSGARDGMLRLNKKDKPVILVLGTGWGAQSLIKVCGAPRARSARRGACSLKQLLHGSAAHQGPPRHIPGAQQPVYLRGLSNPKHRRKS